MTLTTQLNFGGNCEEAFLFYQQHLGGTITMMMKQSQLPGGYTTQRGDKDPVIHIRMNIAGTELLGNDVPAEYFMPVKSAYLYYSADTIDEAERVYALLAEEGSIGMPIAEMFFAHRFAQVRDRFGVLWSIICPKPV